MTNEERGKLIRRLLADKGWSQMDLARATSLDKNTIHNIINGKNKSVLLKSLEEIADALEVSTTILV